MAENNSKKPMALLLLVVVGVLVVLYFAGGESDCNKVVTPGSCSDGVSAEADCTGVKGQQAEIQLAVNPYNPKINLQKRTNFNFLQ